MEQLDTNRCLGPAHHVAGPCGIHEKEIDLCPLTSGLNVLLWQEKQAEKGTGA